MTQTYPLQTVNRKFGTENLVKYNLNHLPKL